MTAPDPLDELDDLLTGIDDDELMLASGVDGLIAASLVAPGPLAEDVWLPAVWGGGEPPFDEATHDRLRALVVARRTVVIGELLRGDYGPVYDIDPRDDVPLWEMWIDGFEEGVALAGAAWEALADHPDEDLAAAAFGLNLLIALADKPRRKRADDERSAQAPDLIPSLVETLYRRARGLPRLVSGPAAGLPGLS